MIRKIKKIFFGKNIVEIRKATLQVFPLNLVSVYEVGFS